MQAYSMDLRERALLDSDAGMKAADVAVKYRVSGSWVRLLKQRRRETGEVAPRVQRHGRRRMLEPHLHTLAALIAEQPDRTLAELKDALGTPASLATIWRAVAALDVTSKKTVRPSEHDRPDVAAARVWHAAAPLGFDTPGFSRNRHYEQSPAAVWSGPPRGPRPRPRAVRPVADQYVSRTWPDRARGLRRRPATSPISNRSSSPVFIPGTSIADNLSAHKVAGVRQAIEQRRHALLSAALQSGPQSH